jgi:hypothetical protein
MIAKIEVPTTPCTANRKGASQNGIPDCVATTGTPATVPGTASAISLLAHSTLGNQIHANNADGIESYPAAFLTGAADVIGTTLSCAACARL